MQNHCQRQSKKSQRKNQKNKKKEAFVGTFWETEDYLRDNQYIELGYRVNHKCFTSSFKSIFKFHNEFVNIWSHLLGFIFLLCFMFYFYNPFEFESPVALQNIQAQIKSLELQFNDQIIQLNQNCMEKQKYTLDLLQQFKNKMLQFNTYYDVKNFFKSIQPQQLNFTYFKEELLSHYNNQYKFQENIVSNIPIYIFFSAAAFCLMCSTIFHIFNCVNYKVYQFLLDMSGAQILMFATTIPYLYYGFYCSPFIYTFYISVLTLITIFVFSISFTNWIQKPENFQIRAIFNSIFAFSLFLPINHLLYQSYYDESGFSIIEAIKYLILAVLFYGIGIIFYATRFPEKFFPKKFSIWFTSHQLWHFAVVIAILITTKSNYEFYNSRSNTSCMIQNQ